MKRNATILIAYSIAVYILTILASGCVPAVTVPANVPSIAEPAPSEPVVLINDNPPIQLLTDPNILFSLVNNSWYRQHGVANADWGDESMYHRFTNNHNMPALDDGFGAAAFNGINSFIAVNDGFMSGLDNFEITMEIIAASEGEFTIICSNWASPNDGDWLLNLTDGRLSFVFQAIDNTWYHGTQVLQLARKYELKISYEKSLITVFVDGVEDISLPATPTWPENGSPLSIGANAHDRSTGMSYFHGSIARVQIRRG